MNVPLPLHVTLKFAVFAALASKVLPVTADGRDAQLDQTRRQKTKN